MAINHGQIYFERVIIDGKPYGFARRVGDDVSWQDYAKATPGHWFIVMMPDGVIISAEEDPVQSMVVGFDIWEIEHDGPGEVLRGKRWDGEKVV